jgi:hypothetical protein
VKKIGRERASELYLITKQFILIIDIYNHFILIFRALLIFNDIYTYFLLILIFKLFGCSEENRKRERERERERQRERESIRITYNN